MFFGGFSSPRIANRRSMLLSSAPPKTSQPEPGAIRWLPYASRARPVVVIPTARKSATRRRVRLAMRSTLYENSGLVQAEGAQRRAGLPPREVREAPGEDEYADDEHDGAEGCCGHRCHGCRSRSLRSETCSPYRPREPSSFPQTG